MKSKSDSDNNFIMNAYKAYSFLLVRLYLIMYPGCNLVENKKTNMNM